MPQKPYAERLSEDEISLIRKRGYLATNIGRKERFNLHTHHTNPSRKNGVCAMLQAAPSEWGAEATFATQLACTPISMRVLDNAKITFF